MGRVTGNPTGRPSRPELERFNNMYMPVTESGCWLWSGRQLRGMFTMSNGRVVLAARAAWTLLRGPIPERMQVCHKCDVSSCVNPDHLFLGTQRDNVLDMYRKGRQPDEAAQARRIAALPRGAQHHRSAAKLTSDQVLAIRSAHGAQRKIAAQFGICQQSVSLIKSGRRWGHL